MHDRKIIEIMSRVITKCQNDEDYTIIDNFQTNYTSRLFVVYNILVSTNLYLINEQKEYIDKAIDDYRNFQIKIL